MPPKQTVHYFVPRDECVLLSCSEMATADAEAISRGLSGSTLMEAAGAAVAATVRACSPKRPVVVLCGPGNNGGDGFVAARRLQEAGWPVRVALSGSRDRLRGDAAWAAGTWTGPIEELGTDVLGGQPLVIDALFGAGLARPIDGVAGEVIDYLNANGLTVIAVDVPSGLHGDTGSVLGRAPTAIRTVTFFRAKPGHYSAEGMRRCGILTVCDIGIPPAVLGVVGARLWANEPRLWRAGLQQDGRNDSKYSRGHLTILGGSLATGAARLAAIAGRRAGAGLVTIAAPRSAKAVYQAAEPGNLVVEADDSRSFAELLHDVRRNAILVGPGSGLDGRTRASSLAALATGRPVILDADAITIFASDPPSLFGAINGPVLLTPHQGEFGRLFPDLAKMPGKVERARLAAARSGATVLLKGPDTVIASPDGRAVVNVHASPGLATAGAGDVLAGIAGGLMARGLEPLAAASAAAWIHGECAVRFGRRGLIAEDLIDLLPEALHSAACPN